MSIECPVCISLNDASALVCTSCGAPLQPENSTSSGNSSPSSGGPTSTYQLPTGTVLQNSRYRVDGHLGTGGFGITYKGFDLNKSSEVAIKELWPEKAARQGAVVTWPSSILPAERKKQLGKFQSEAACQARCVHPNIARVFDWFEQNNTAYIVMEFVQGQPLSQIFKTEGILPEARVKHYFVQIGEALGAVHNESFLHRDIKPENILIGPQDNAVLIDFGSTREFIAGQTTDMSIILTKGYAPIEQYSPASRRWPATDFYALCASMYELLTGDFPADSVSRLRGDPLVPPRQKNPNISALLEKVILHGMEMKVEDRFQTADELISALNGQFVAPSHQRARGFIQQGKLAEATQAYKKYLADSPDDAEAVVELAMVQIYTDISEAEINATHAVQLAPNDGRGHGVLGLLACQQSRWTDAYCHLQQAAALSASEAWIQTNFAWALGKTGRWKEAEATIEKALKLSPQDTFAKGLKAWIAAQQQQWKLVIGSAKPAIFQSKQRQSNNSRVLQQWVYPLLVVALSKAVKNQSQNNDVERCIQDFVTQNDQSSAAWGLKGWREASRGQWDGAVQRFERAAQLQAPPDWVLINLGIAYERANNLSAAVGAYENCMRQYPESGHACFRLGTVQARLGKWAIAQNLLEKAVELTPENGSAHHNLAWVLLKVPGQKERTELRRILSVYREAVACYARANNRAMVSSIKAAFRQVGIDM